MNVREKLHPDLQSCIHREKGRTVLRHRLLAAVPYQGRFAAIYNREYQAKLADLARLEAAGRWDEVVWLHERQFRPRALWDAAATMSDQQYWIMVSRVWLDSDVQEPFFWTQLWSAKRPYREQVMTEDEHRMLVQLPSEVMIYRGDRRGLSWSLSRHAARAYARRINSRFMTTAIVEKRHIQALYADRQDAHQDVEVVVFDKHCFRVTVAERSFTRLVAA